MFFILPQLIISPEVQGCQKMAVAVPSTKFAKKCKHFAQEKQNIYIKKQVDIFLHTLSNW